ncbi:DUF4142 domain-containing protein [Roseisolibacter sp. H3M3-2]|uniref:DUF4142 domain-containing protein n=1 Tax=Roseisolibacter sp. H3M3-2 TaxID=3031323 RepID=UPI0023DA1CA5|nr:DUF4142 domain-containing protein [Roseisolibacter sp. H3M3-2]MDF1502762.1 DUF4142 domain-containing protein [Roseisolibacter sp. H3M3-2]
MRVRRTPLSAAALTVVLVAGAAGPASAQQPATRDTTRAPRTGSASGEVVPGRVTKEIPTARPATPTPGAARTDSATPMRAPSPSPDMAGAGADAAAAPIVASLRSDAHALALLHESNLGEIAAGQRAVREAADSGVRAFAQRMITEHTALDQQGMQLGQRAGVAPALPDSQLPALQQRELQMLPSGTGGAASTTTPASGSALSGATPGTTPGGTSPASSPMPGTTGTPGTTGSTTGGTTGGTPPTGTTTDPTRGSGRVAGATTPGVTPGGTSPASSPMPGTTDTTRAGAAANPHAGHDMSAGAMSAGGGASAFDRAYVAQQVAAHARTLALVDAAIARGENAELKTALQSQVRPAVAAHLEEARALQARVGGR